MLNVGFLLLTFHVLVLVKTCEQTSHVHVVKKTSNLNSLMNVSPAPVTVHSISCRDATRVASSVKQAWRTEVMAS